MAPRLAARVAVVCLFGATSVVYAERRPVAVIVLNDVPGTRALADRLDGLLGTHPELEPISSSDTAALLDPLTASDDTPLLADARSFKERAEQAVAQYQFHDVPPYVADGEAKLLSIAPRAAVPLYADLVFLLGLAYLGEQKPTDAAAAFVLTKKLDPSRTVDAARYVPEVARAFDAARPSLTALATLSVKGTGRAWIDGEEVGPAPGDYRVPYGMHVVWVTGVERETRGRVVPYVAAGATLDVAVPDAEESRRAKLQHARRVVAEAPDPAARSAAMRHLAELAGVHDAVLVSSANGKVIAQTWRDRAPGFSALHEVMSASKPMEILDLLAPPPPPPEPPPVILPLVELRWYERRPVQLGAAASFVVAAIVGVLLYERRGVVYQLPDPNPQWKPGSMSKQ